MSTKEESFDLTNDTHYSKVRTIADSFLTGSKTLDELWKVVNGENLFYSLGAFLAISKIKLEDHKNKRLRIAILMNLVHEHNRLRPSSDENPNGENSLENKLDQLKWIFSDTRIEYKLIYVSGGCPWGSDDVLESEIQRIGAQNVIHLRIDKSPTGNSFTKNQKGGEIIFGIKSILQMPGYPDFGYFDCMLFTDADMTFDLGQIGIAIDKYYRGIDLLTGNRMASNSVLVKNMTRAGNGILMYRHIQRKLAPVFFIDRNLHDTQCPWKFLSHRVLKDIADVLDSMDWSIDTDILSAAEKYGYSLYIIPVTAIDSELESHGRAIGHFRRNRTIIEGTLHQAKKYNLRYDKEIANLVGIYLKNDKDYQIMLESGLPPSISSLPNKDWGRSPLITISLIKDWFDAFKDKNSA